MADRFEEKVLSVTKALTILEVLANETDGLSLNDLSIKTGMNKTTIYRLLTSLLERNFVEQDTPTSKYYLGTRILSLASSFFRENDIRSVVQRQVAGVFFGIPHHIFLGKLINRKLTVIDCHRGGTGVASAIQIGASIPFHCTAMGKVFLVYSPDKFILNTLSQSNLAAYTERTITSFAKLKEHLKLISIQCFATDHGEYEEAIGSVAVPIFDYSRNIVASLGICFPLASLSEREEADITLNMLDLSQKISAKLGYNAV